jgi:hypothetical protein
MIVVAGNPRSGTSLMMRCFVEAVGMDRVMGDEFPQVKRHEAMLKQGEEESDAHYAARMYVSEKYPENSEEAVEKAKDMNPNGFWECPFTVRGIGYKPGVTDLIKQMEEEAPKNPLIIKLVNSGLFASEPKYVTKVVYMLRHPRNIAKSQERLQREQKFTLKDGRVVDLYEGQKVHDPRFYLQSTTQFAQWRLANPDVPLLIVHYDDLVADPEAELKKIADFTGVPDLAGSSSMINPKLKRSEWDMSIKSNLWEPAEAVHECLLKEDYQGILDVVSDPEGEYTKMNTTFICARLRSAIAYNNCVSCRTDMNKAFIESGKKRSNANGWQWWEEPCMFECGFNPCDKSPLTVAESIKNNHWSKV